MVQLNRRLSKLCDRLGYPNSKMYFDSLVWKLECAYRHNLNSEGIWNKLIGAKAIRISSKKWRDVQFESEIESIACAHQVHTWMDLLLQIINCSMLNNCLHESRVGIRYIKSRLSSRGMIDILGALNALENSPEYRYIHHFDNTHKHRRLLDTDYTITSRRGIVQNGVRFKAFDFNVVRGGQVTTVASYPITWAFNITNRYRKRVFELICDVVNEMIKYLRNEFKLQNIEKQDLLSNPIFD
jgi:hypothetical protein